MVAATYRLFSHWIGSVLSQTNQQDPALCWVCSFERADPQGQLATAG